MKKTLAVVAMLVLGVVIVPVAFGQNLNPSGSLTPPPQPGSQAPTNLTTVGGVFNWFNTIIRWISLLFWALVVVMIIYTGYLYLTARGDSEKVGTAHTQLRYTIVAIAVALLATVLPTLVRSFLGGR